MTRTRWVESQGLGAKTRQLDVRSSASIEGEAIRERWAEQVNDALELAQVADRVDHRSYARQGVEMEPTVKMGHASAARSEEHTSELQSLMRISYAVFCLKKKKKKTKNIITHAHDYQI